MNKLVKRLLTGTLAFATILTALPVTAVHASGNQYLSSVALIVAAWVGTGALAGAAAWGRTTAI